MYHYYRSIIIGQTLALHIIQFYCHIVVLEWRGVEMFSTKPLPKHVLHRPQTIGLF